MGSLSKFAAALQAVYQRIYSGWVKRAIHRTGINRILSKPFWRLVYLLSGDHKVCRINGESVKFLTDTHPEFMRFRDLKGEREVLSDVMESFDQGDIFYDVGANVGIYTCFAASMINSGEVVAFEPEPNNIEHLQLNLELNGLKADIQQTALADSNGSVELSLAGAEAGEGEHALSTNSSPDTLEVPMAKGDSIIDRNDLPSPTVVKIDVEGAELAVLRGLQNTLAESVRLIYVEVHPSKLPEFGDSASDVREFLGSAGYEVTEISERGDEVFLRGAK